jgi:hypothetical protein
MTRDTYDMFGDPDRGRFGDNEYSAKSPRVTGASDLHDLDLVLHAETEKAILVSPDGTEARAAWLPKSRVEIYRGGLNANAIKRSGQRVVLPVITVTVPEGLAKEKGLI